MKKNILQIDSAAEALDRQELAPAQGARELAEGRIRQAIVTGEFLPGEHLSERELCELTGVSRAALREALRSLVSDCVITVVRFRGPMVAQLTEKEARDIYDMRAVLEGYAAELFVLRASDAQVEELCACIEEIGIGHDKGDMVVVINSSQRFY